MIRMMTLIAAATITVAGMAQAGDCRHKKCHEGRCVTCGDKVCIGHAVPAKETKECYLTECRDICIPKIHFPWQKCCKPRCGRVISVRVLLVKEYECNTCKWEWKIKDCKACRAGCCFEHHVPDDSDTVPPIPPKPGAVSTPVVNTSRVLVP